MVSGLSAGNDRHYLVKTSIGFRDLTGVKPDYGTLIKKAGYTLLTGVMGSVILVVFLSTVMRFDNLGYVAPWAIGFNAAMVGYGLVEKTRDSLAKKHLWAGIAGCVMGLTAFAALNAVFMYFTGILAFGLVDLVIYLGICLVFAELGAILAIKYFKLEVR